MRPKLTGAHPDFGDRRCQLTVSGANQELDVFMEAVQTCLCTDEEVAAWTTDEDFPDPWQRSLATSKAPYNSLGGKFLCGLFEPSDRSRMVL